MNTIQELLSEWDKLVVVGTTPEKHDSILTMCGDTKVAIEFMLTTSETMGKPYTVAYIVGYTPHGHRFTIQSWGCHGEDELVFHKWFMRKYNAARNQDYAEQNVLKGIVLDQIANTSHHEN